MSKNLKRFLIWLIVAIVTLGLGFCLSSESAIIQWTGGIVAVASFAVYIWYAFWVDNREEEE